MSTGRGRPRIEEVLGLPGDYRVTRYRRDDGGLAVAHVRRDPRDRVCPRCGARGHVNGHRWRKVWHAPACGGRTMLMLDQIRFRCPACGKTWNDGHGELLGRASPHMTRGAEELVTLELMERRSVRSISADVGPSRHMVNRVIDRALLDARYLPETLCIDEFKADTDRGKMAIGIYDWNCGAVAEVLPELSAPCLDGYFGSFSEKERARVRFFCCDMSETMVKRQREWFPQAELCIDRFHVVKLVNDAFSDVRKRIMADPSLDAGLRRQLRGSWKLFLTDRRRLAEIDDGYAAELADRRIRIASALDLTEEEMLSLPGMRPREPRLARVDRLLSLFPELEVAYRLMHDFRLLFRLGWWDGMGAELDRWCRFARQSGIPELVRCARTLKRNRDGVLNGHRYARTNAVAEGLNNAIKEMKRISYGYKSFDRMRRRVLLALGFCRLERPTTAINHIEP